MKVLDLRSHDLRRALTHPHLAGKEIVGRGNLSIVYGGDKTVTKVTIDTSFCRLIERRGPKLAALPRRIKNHGVIGMYQGTAPIEAIEVERLHKLKASSGNYRLASSVCAVINRHADKVWFALKDTKTFTWQPVIKSALPDLRKMRGVQPKLIATILALSKFVDRHDLDLDLHIRNFMERRETRELVICDPVVNRDMWGYLGRRKDEAARA